MKSISILLVFLFSISLVAQKLPEGFVYLDNIIPTVKVELRYFSNNNFIGKPIEGYRSNCIITTTTTANALKNVQEELAEKNLGLKIFDAYRPQRAVNHFVRWAKVLEDTLMKKTYYPKVKKSELFKQGYIASRSGHSRGSSVDLTIVDLKTNKELDMGSIYDFFGSESHPSYRNISKKQLENRILLRNIMIKHGFKPYKNEWWHFTIRNEPFPKTYFNFEVN
ncbi:M15 family metallopeptidase [Polaribacter sp. OB-PA-B3]